MAKTEPTNSPNNEKTGNVQRDVKYRINTVETAALLLVATIFDILSILPGINVAVVIVGQCLMALFFFFSGVSVFGKRKTIAYIVGWVVEFIPAISILPAFILETVLIIMFSRIEDRTGVDVIGTISASKNVGGVGKQPYGKEFRDSQKAKLRQTANYAENKAEQTGEGGLSKLRTASKNLISENEDSVEQIGKKLAPTEFGTGKYIEAKVENRRGQVKDSDAERAERWKRLGYQAPEIDPSIEANKRMAEEYDRKATESELHGRSEEAELYRQTAGNLRRETENGKSGPDQSWRHREHEKRKGEQDDEVDDRKAA